MREPQEIEDEDHEQVVERVAAVDVPRRRAWCTRVPHESKVGRRVTKVWRSVAGRVAHVQQDLVAALTVPHLVAGVAGIIGMWTIGWPQLTPEGYFRHHRDDLALLAADYRAGRLGTDNGLPLRLRSMSVDFQSHHRCGLTDPQTGPKDCALFLLAWQDWRAEVGVGFAYYPTRPGPEASLMTAAGDIGRPTRELGDGWWWVD